MFGDDGARTTAPATPNAATANTTTESLGASAVHAAPPPTSRPYEEPPPKAFAKKRGVKRNAPKIPKVKMIKVQSSGV
jgi:hypothetical protein